ncbi:flagellar export chaperone FlgN [candidate division KSB1 bacterium]|nr:flagellar export chaperone FlgN [candidate division KSB1 bacterium]
MKNITIANIEPALLEYINHQLEIANHLFELSQQQRSFIENGDIQKVFSTNSKKMNLLHAIQQSDNGISALETKSGLPSGSDAVPEITNLIAELNLVMQHFVESETDNMTILSHQGEKFQKELDTILSG